MNMKILIVMLASLFVTLIGNAQQIVKDVRNQNEREDSFDYYQSDKISNLDILEALDVLGVNILKFETGEFTEKLGFGFIIEEYKDGKLIKTDSLYNRHNMYHYFTEETGNKPLHAYIDQIRIITKQNEDELFLTISTYRMKMNKSIKYKKTDSDQRYFLRHYSQTNWALNKKTPLFVYASSWKDKKSGVHRFCGVVDLSENKSDTKELLSKSPHYFIFSYYTKKIKEE